MSLREIEIQSSYETYKDDPVIDFYVPALSEAVLYKRIAGFFTSGSLAVAARGIGRLVENGGHIQIIACPKLTEADATTVKDVVEDPEKYLGDVLMREIDYFEDKLEQDHVAALGWMLANNLLELRIAVVEDDGAANEQLFHQKIGIIEDANGDVISFSGSVNETAAGWLENVEEFKVFKSWRDADREWMEPDLRKFAEFWNNERDYVSVVELPHAVRERLIEVGANFHSDSIAAKKYIESRGAKRKDELSLFPYQRRAVIEWENNDRRLLFEMATGTGKTRTAIACIYNVLKESKPLLAVIATPQSTLSRQWKESFDDLNVSFESVIFADGSNPKWFDQLENSLLDLKIGLLDNIAVFTTHATASSDRFVELMESATKHVVTIFAGDETHALGARKQRRAMLDSYKCRIGLSATPARWFDDAGSELIRSYYGDKSFVFSIADALNTVNPLTGETFLTPYNYHPILVHLDSYEMEEYASLSKRISMQYAIKENGSGAFNEEGYQRLLERRADLLKNAASKMPALKKLLRNADVKDSIIFVSPQQKDDVLAMLKELGIIAHKFTEREGTKPSDKYGGLSEREHLIKCFVLREYKALVAINCLNEGIDIPSADTAYLMSNSTNPREYIQRVGRVIRRSKGKIKAHIFDFITLPSFSWKEDDDKTLEEKLLSKELLRVEAMAKNADNRGEVAGIVTRIWEEFYHGA